MTSTELIDCTRLANGAVIDVETKTRHYRIECLGGNAINISGHPEYCPEPTAARLHGSVDPEGVLELGMIGRGMRLCVLLNGYQPITTTRVVRLLVDHPAPAVHTSSIH
jgi:hypothetical protein